MCLINLYAIIFSFFLSWVFLWYMIWNLVGIIHNYSIRSITCQCLVNILGWATIWFVTIAQSRRHWMYDETDGGCNRDERNKNSVVAVAIKMTFKSTLIDSKWQLIYHISLHIFLGVHIFFQIRKLNFTGWVHKAHLVQFR